MTSSIVAALLAVVSSSDVRDVSENYTGRVSSFQLTHKASLLQAARLENPVLRPPIFRYCACRWNYRLLMSQLDADNKADLKQTLYHDYTITITNPKNGRTLDLRPVDWGPARWTGRLIDIDSVSMRELGLKTDDEVEIVLKKRM